MSHYKNLVNLLMTVARQYGTWEVFKDFIEMTSIAFSNSVDYSMREIRESQYMEIVKRYDKKHLDLFPKMLYELTMAMEVEPSDILGRIYGELELANKWRGQIFTPDSICRMMGQIVLTDDMKSIIDEKGFITVQEPAIGGGALIINLALAMQEEKINYQQSMVVTGVDVDIKSIHMAYIQLSLLHIPAILVHGNSLSMEVHSKWYTPAYIMGGWKFRRQREKQVQGQVIELKASKKDSLVKVKPVKIAKYEPISLFG